MRLHPWVFEAFQLLASHTNSANALAMKAYMKGQFNFLGQKKPMRTALTEPLFQRQNLPPKADLETILLELWAQPEREYQLLGLDLIRKFEKKLEPADLPWIERLICEKSWWDTVDFLATHAIGSLLERHPIESKAIVEPWIHSPNLWLNRSVIIAQILYRKQLDFRLLEDAIKPHHASTEFFHRKAIGWALRSVSERHPQWTIDYVERYAKELSGLSQREALRKLK